MSRDRRLGRRGRAQGDELAALQARIAPLFYSWVSADRFTGTALQDRLVASRTFTQVGTAATRSTYNGRPCLVCNGGQQYQADDVTSNWAFTADGTGCDIYAVYRATTNAGLRVLYGSASSAAQGISHYFNGANVTYDIHNGATDAVSGSVIGSNVANVLSWSRLSHGTARSPQRYGQLRNTAAVSGAYANPAAAGATSHTFSLFANSGVAFGWQGEWFETLIANRVLTADESTLVERYLALRYG